MKRILSMVIAISALATGVAVAMPSQATAACNTGSGIQGSAFYTDVNCGGSLFNMTGNLNKSYVGDSFNDKITSILVGHNAGSGTVSEACLWTNATFTGTMEKWINGSSSTAKYINLTSDPMQDKASSASTHWGTGSPAPQCAY